MLTQTCFEVWDQFLLQIKERCSATEFSNWFGEIRVICREGDRLCLEVPNAFVINYIKTQYGDALSGHFGCSDVSLVPIDFQIKETPKAPAKLALPPRSSNSGSKNALRLNPSYTFDNFIEGATNQFVKAAAMSVANKPGKANNPLFIYGGVGLGKTHLLHAIGHKVTELHRWLKVRCLTTEEFVNELMEHLKERSLLKMKDAYRNLDLLLIDDIQFLQSRSISFHEEVCATIESLINQNKQLVITSDKTPHELGLSERLTARMEWGLVACVGIPDLETRVAILQHKAEQRGLRLPQKVAFLIATHVFHSVRQLEGIVNLVSARYKQSGEAIEEIVHSSLKELLPIPVKKKVSMDTILKSVALAFGVSAVDLTGPSRSQEVALPRQVAMHIAKEFAITLAKIASSIKRKHPTVLHGLNKIAQLIKQDPHFRHQIELVKQDLDK